MENSTNFPEESSWTFYIQGFMCDKNNNNDDDRNSCFSSEFESPSLVSDAASSAVKKPMTETRESSCKSAVKNKMCKQNSFKKHKTYKVISSMDHDLEDTASSPVNSPKVSYINQFLNQKEKAKMDVAEVQRNIFGKGGVFSVQRDSNCTELKRGI